MKRREFLSLVGGTAAAMPLAARAQQRARMRRIGVLMGDRMRTIRMGQARLAAFRQGLQQLGWTDGRNSSIDIRWGAGNAERNRKHAAELVASGAGRHSGPFQRCRMAPLLQETRTVPIVFTVVADPVGAGYVASLARPGGNVTGFTNV